MKSEYQKKALSLLTLEEKRKKRLTSFAINMIK